MTVANWPRLVATTLFALALALALAAQALSTVSTRAAPELAVSAFAANGLAREQLAFEVFTAGVDDPDDVTKAARGAADIALESIRSEPLTPKAQAILALAATSPAIRNDILDAASELNRRDLSLQGLVLQRHIAARDYPATIGTLDQLLRVHPEYSREFFPVLLRALEEEATIPLFAEMLDNSSPWHESFLVFAAGEREVLPNLALLRPDIVVEDETFDRRLIAGLAGEGDVAGAEALYQQVVGEGVGLAGEGVLDWRSTYPPFEWRFVDEAGFRAQQSRSGKELEISVRPGRGGIIATRLLKAPEAPFVIRIKHRIAPASQLRDVRLQLICSGEATPFFDERFSRQDDAFRIENVPGGCAYMVLAINARAWSGRSALTGIIDQISLTQLRQ